MTQDWNWFFSSLSQSAAAIVGIFGAFIITKIFSNQSIYTEKTNRLKLILIQARKISDKANTHNTSWYNKTLNKIAYGSFKRDLLDKFPDIECESDNTDAAIKEYIKSSKFSIYSEPSEIVVKLKDLVKEYCEYNKARKIEEANSHKMQRAFQLGDTIKFIDSPPSKSHMEFTVLPSFTSPPWDKLRKVEEGLAESYLEAKHHARVVSDFLDSIKGNPESPPQITHALILVLFLFFMGVIYPLSFMPASNSPTLGFSFELITQHIISLKGFFLITISIAFTTIVLLFFNTNIKMKYPPNTVKKLEDLALPKNYCESFKHMTT